MQGHAFFVPPMSFQRFPCPLDAVGVTPRQAVDESAHHETTGHEIYQK